MRKLHALVIDDDIHSLTVIAEMLTEEEIGVTKIDDPTLLRGDFAEQLGTFDLVFLDLEMPSLDGYEVLHTLKQHLDKEIPIVAYTIHTNELKNARNSGFHSFLGKPLDIDRFPGQLHRILNDEHVWEIF